MVSVYEREYIDAIADALDDLFGRGFGRIFVDFIKRQLNSR